MISENNHERVIDLERPRIPAPDLRPAEPPNVGISHAQRRHLQRLINDLQMANAAIEEAERVRDKAQATANNFLAYVAEEIGVPIGREGWVFDQDAMRFVQGPQLEEGGDNGDN